MSRVVALTTDLMDRSKITAAIPGVAFALSADADVVIVDLARGDVSEVRSALPNARIVAYGPHVDEGGAAAARAAGADTVLPRSRFFHDPAAACR